MKTLLWLSLAVANAACGNWCFASACSLAASASLFGDDDDDTDEE